MKKLFPFPLFLALSLASAAQKNASISFEKWISLKNVFAPLISDDGHTIVFTQGSTEWSNNSYDNELWMSRHGAPPVQLTRTPKGGSFGARISPDGKWVGFLADRGDKTQLYIISVSGGEALQVTKEENGIASYEWSPDGKWIAFTMIDAESKKDKEVRNRYGAFGVEGEEYRQNHLWLLRFDLDSILLAGSLPCYEMVKDSTKTATHSSATPECYKLPVATRLTEGDFNVGNFSWRPDGRAIVFNRTINPLINSGITADIVLADIGTKKTTTLVSQPGGDSFGRWNREGSAFVYQSSQGDTSSHYYRNNRVFVYDMTSGQSREIAKDIDENKYVIDWNSTGIYFSAWQKTAQKVFLTDPKTGKSRLVSIPLDMVSSLSFGEQTDEVALAGRSYNGLTEIYYGKLGQPLKKLTDNSSQIAGWNIPVNEVISWTSRDGAAIEGVLHKPDNFDAKKKYPLLVVIHGGPTGIDIPDPTTGYVYPIMQWVEKGALVLRVNYRGSAGYGEKFRALNVRNLGVGDMWDVMSGIDHLVAKGFVDSSRLGSMGWSQGGYISAFLATNTHRFKAISVGAGISNWVTYYVNTDITPFTRQYLQATPWNDMEIYLKTSPMTNINNASTPTLIQHGEFDKRVPLPNAYELYRGLQDRGIPSRLIVYKGFGHGINKPKERLAAIWHNWQWFNRYIFGEQEEIPY